MSEGCRWPTAQVIRKKTCDTFTRSLPFFFALMSSYSFRRKLWARAPDLGNNPLTYCELFFIATKTIYPNDWMTWYYGHFHGIFKHLIRTQTDKPLSSSFDDSSSDDSDSQSDEDDSEDDMQMAAKLSKQVIDDHKVALALQQSLNSGGTDVVQKKDNAVEKQIAAVVEIGSSDSDDGKSRDFHIRPNEEDDARGSCKRKLNIVGDDPESTPLPSGVPIAKSLRIEDKCYIASTAADGSVRFQTCFVKALVTNFSRGLVTHYDVSLGNFSNPTYCAIVAVQAHEDLAAHASAKQKRIEENLQLKAIQDETVRQESFAKYASGQLVFRQEQSPGHTPSPAARTSRFENDYTAEQKYEGRHHGKNAVYFRKGFGIQDLRALAWRQKAGYKGCGRSRSTQIIFDVGLNCTRD